MSSISVCTGGVFVLICRIYYGWYPGSTALSPKRLELRKPKYFKAL